MTIVDSQTSEENWLGVFKEFEDAYPWGSKTRKVIWRGALSEAEWRDALTSVRWRAAKMVHELQNEHLDIGLTSIPTWLTEKIDFDLSQIGGFKNGIAPMVKFQNYMAILDMDGNSWSSRFGSLLCYNSVVLKVEPKYFEYFYADLKPWTHYIPVKNDLSDLEEHSMWALDPKNEAVVRDMIRAANQWCSQRLTPPELALDMLDTYETYVRLLNRADPNWSEAWRLKRDLISSSDSMFDLQLL
jgi:Glycosyl transferase family 90